MRGGPFFVSPRSGEDVGRGADGSAKGALSAVVAVIGAAGVGQGLSGGLFVHLALPEVFRSIFDSDHVCHRSSTQVTVLGLPFRATR